MKRGWFGRRESDVLSTLLGFEMVGLLTLNRSPMEARSPNLGGLALYNTYVWQGKLVVVVLGVQV